MPYPLNPSQDHFDDYDDVRAELSNYLFIKWKNELTRTEGLKFPNFPLKPIPQATSTWIEWKLIFGKNKVKCIGSYNNKKVGELTVLQRIFIHTPLNEGNGRVNSIADTVISLYPANFSLRSARLIAGMLPEFREIGARSHPEYSNVTGWYDGYVDIPIDVTILM